MGIRRGPSIVTDGLTFAVDAANPDSYISGSTIWKDQTVNQNNGTLINGPTFDSADGGSIVFDGTDDYVDIADNDNLSFGDGATDSPFSISTWVKMDDATKFRAVGKYGASKVEYLLATDASDKISFNLYDDSTSGKIGRKFNTALTSYQGQWIHFVATYNGNSNASGLKIYLNGARVDDTNNVSGTYTAMENTTQPLYFGKLTTTYANGNIASVQIYNRELSSNEVLQNYNALKGRFE